MQASQKCRAVPGVDDEVREAGSWAPRPFTWQVRL